MHVRLEAITADFKLPQGADRVAGRELAYFIPAHLEWTQLSYGQGEGQALIAGAAFGFSLLEDGVFDSIVDDVGEHLFGSGRFRVVLVGTDD